MKSFLLLLCISTVLTGCCASGQRSQPKTAEDLMADPQFRKVIEELRKSETQRWEYRVLINEPDANLNRLARDGWVVDQMVSGGPGGGAVILMKRPLK